LGNAASPWSLPGAPLLGGLAIGGGAYGGWKLTDWLLDRARKLEVQRELAASKAEYEKALKQNGAGQAKIATQSNLLPGGLGDATQPEDVRPSQLRKGREVEREHTSNGAVATEIALDHLTEDPMYYDRLALMEGGSPKSAAVEIEDMVMSPVNAYGALAALATAMIAHSTYKAYAERRHSELLAAAQKQRRRDEEQKARPPIYAKLPEYSPVEF
jgi:hypothetical protein